MLRTRRIARLIWRHTPPLRSAIERDDWLQSAALEILSLHGENGDCGVSHRKSVTGREPSLLGSRRKWGKSVTGREPSLLGSDYGSSVHSSRNVDPSLSPDFPAKDLVETAIIRSLRALAQRLIYRHENSVRTISMSNSEFDEMEVPAPEVVSHRRKIPVILLRRKNRYALIMSRKTPITLGAFIRLRRCGYLAKTIAKKFGISRGHLRRLIAHWKRRNSKPTTPI